MDRPVRVLAALLLLLGGAIHVNLWRWGYGGIPYIGPLFLANVIASVAVGLVLVVRGGRLVLLAGVGLAVGSLAALVMSRTVGLLGFTEPGWTIDAMRTVAAEVGALVTLGVVVVMRRGGDDGVMVPAFASQSETGFSALEWGAWGGPVPGG